MNNFFIIRNAALNMTALFCLLAQTLFALPENCETTPLWPEGKLPDLQEHQVKSETPRLEWYAAPEKPNPAKGCLILISGGAYECRCDMPWIDAIAKRMTELGFQCVNLAYRVPRPKGLPIYQTAWEDGQRAVRIVRSEAKKRGYSPENIGALGFSAGSHLTVMLGVSSQTPAYEPIDELDQTPCHINWAIPIYTAYALSDGLEGPNTRDGNSIDVQLTKAFKFDARSCPMCLFHGGTDLYSPNGSTEIYRALRKLHVPAELHLFADRSHGFMGKWGTKACEGAPYDTWFERAEEFLRQMNFDGRLGKEEKLMDRFASDDARGEYLKEEIWPEGAMPDVQTNQTVRPYIEWHFPKERKTKSIQIVYSGGGYYGNDPNGFEAAPVRRYLNEKGMTVVTLKHREPRPLPPLAKHISAWQDLQRAVRIVRKKAPEYGLDPNMIGVMGCSAGGHLTLMGCLNSMSHAYWPIDETDNYSCSVQWGVAVYPAYCITDQIDRNNNGDGNGDDVRIVKEFAFDRATPPVLFLHGDSDGWSSMNSVKVWEQLRRMGIQSELHTFATRNHCFQAKAAPQTGSYNFMDRIWEFMNQKGFNK